MRVNVRSKNIMDRENEYYMKKGMNTSDARITMAVIMDRRDLRAVAERFLTFSSTKIETT